MRNSFVTGDLSRVSSYKTLELIYHEFAPSTTAEENKKKVAQFCPFPFPFPLADKSERSQTETWVLSNGHGPARQSIKGLCNENHSAKENRRMCYQRPRFLYLHLLSCNCFKRQLRPTTHRFYH